MGFNQPLVVVVPPPLRRTNAHLVQVQTAMCTDPSLRGPGDGADRPDSTHQQRRYVYVARSRRAGGMSLGIDLTPDGHCSFSCVYCQASHPPGRNPDLTVDVSQMRNDLLERLREDRGELKDIVLAGSGEPTSVPNLGEALGAIQDVCSILQVEIPRKLFTNGRHLDQSEVHKAVGSWRQQGGEVWVKLDGAQDDSVARINGRRFDVAKHLRALWAFSCQHEIGIQTMLFRGPGLPSLEQTVKEVAEALKEGLAIGARISEVHLLTLSRPPANQNAASVLKDIPADELENFASQIRNATNLMVTVFPSQITEPSRK